MTSVASGKLVDLTRFMYMGERGSANWKAFADSPQYYVPARDIANVSRPEARDVLLKLSQRFNVRAIGEMGPGGTAKQKSYSVVEGCHPDRYFFVENSEEILDAATHTAERYFSKSGISIEGSLTDFYDPHAFDGLIRPNQNTLLVCWGSTLTNLGSYGLSGGDPRRLMSGRIRQLSRNTTRLSKGGKVILAFSFDAGTPDLQEAYEAYSGNGLNPWRDFTGGPFFDFARIVKPKGSFDTSLLEHRLVSDMDPEKRILHTLKVPSEDCDFKVPKGPMLSDLDEKTYRLKKDNPIQSFPLWKPFMESALQSVEDAGATVLHRSQHETMSLVVCEL